MGVAIRWTEVFEHVADDWARIYLYTGIALFPFLWSVYLEMGASIYFRLLFRTEATLLLGMGVANILSGIAHLLKERDEHES